MIGETDKHLRLLKGTDFTSNLDECIASDCDRPNLRQVDRMLDNLVGFTVGFLGFTEGVAVDLGEGTGVGLIDGALPYRV